MATPDYDRLLTAINTGDLTSAERLVKSGINLNSDCDDGASSLFAAIINGHANLVATMLELGANPNFIADEPAASTYTEKPLDLAMQARFLMNWDLYHPIVELLIQHGATDYDGKTETPEQLAIVKQRALAHQRNR